MLLVRCPIVGSLGRKIGCRLIKFIIDGAQYVREDRLARMGWRCANIFGVSRLGACLPLRKTDATNVVNAGAGENISIATDGLRSNQHTKLCLLS